MPAGALVAARGWPTQVSARICLRVVDRLDDRWATPHALEIDGGEGRLVPHGGDADVTADVRALGPLLWGHHDAHTLRRAGLLDGPADALTALTAACAGPTPTVLDFF